MKDLNTTDNSTNIFEFIKSKVIGSKFRCGEVWVASYCYSNGEILRNIKPSRAYLSINPGLFEELINGRNPEETIQLLEENSKWLNISFNLKYKLLDGKYGLNFPLISNVRVPGFKINIENNPVSLFNTEEEAMNYYDEKVNAFNSRKMFIDFSPIDGKLGIKETIESMVHHLNLISGSLMDTPPDSINKDTILRNVSIRNNGLQSLNTLLQEYLKQVGIVYQSGIDK